MYDDDEDIIDWGSSFRLQTGWQPFTSIDGVVVDPDVVTFGFAYPGATADEVFTWTNGATPPDPTYTIQRKVITITAVTPSDPATGSVLYQSSTPHNYQAPTYSARNDDYHCWHQSLGILGCLSGGHHPYPEYIHYCQRDNRNAHPYFCHLN
jgi:hypothetical protein